MYPNEPVVTVDPGPMGDVLEGEFLEASRCGVLRLPDPTPYLPEIEELIRKVRTRIAPETPQ